MKPERVRELGSTEKFWPPATELAGEVLSPSDTVYEIEEKVVACDCQLRIPNEILERTYAYQ